MNDCVVYSKDGAVLNRSRNLRGIRRYVSNHLVKEVCIAQRSVEGRDLGGMLSIRFDDGAFFNTDFASFEVLRYALSNWRNLYGTPLFINGARQDVVGRNNPALQTSLRG